MPPKTEEKKQDIYFLYFILDWYFTLPLIVWLQALAELKMSMFPLPVQEHSLMTSQVSAGSETTEDVV